MVDIFEKDGTMRDYATWREISRVASLIVFGCVRKATGYSGGFIQDVGKDFLAVTSGCSGRLS